jgi:acetylornithine/succinyldiaminopimelate/putrescine aminotransferase
MPVFGPPSIMFERGSGTELWDSNGKRYLDFLAGIAVTSLGHSHPAIAQAISDQATRLLHVSNFFANPMATEAAIKINRLLLDATNQHGQIFFTNSGAESNECALKLARKQGRSRAAHRRERARQLSRAYLGVAGSYGAANETRAVLPDALTGSSTSRGETSTPCAQRSMVRLLPC